MTKDERQEIVIQRIIEKQGNCWLDIIMGFGKTLSAVKLIKKALLKNPNTVSYIVVPTNTLKSQWNHILSINSIPNFTVEVVHNVIRQESISCDVCIVDEGHLMLSKEFIKIFTIIKRKALIVMSGTWSQEHKEIINQIVPLADRITLREALANGWVSKRKEYALYVELNQENKLLYEHYKKLLDTTFSYFGHDWNVLNSCLKTTNARAYAASSGLRIKKQNSDEYMNSFELGTFLATKANIYLRILKQRNELIHNSKEKLAVVAELVRKANLKTVTFGLNTESADTLTLALPNSKAYHSNIKGSTEEYSNEFLAKYNIPYKVKKDTSKLSKENILKLHLALLEAGDISCINSAKALDVGLDVKGMECAIIYGRTSKQEKNNQRTARSTRTDNNDGKLALIVHVVLKGTQDEKWFKSATRENLGITNFTTVDEIINDYEKEKLKLNN